MKTNFDVLLERLLKTGFTVLFFYYMYLNLSLSAQPSGKMVSFGITFNLSSDWTFRCYHYVLMQHQHKDCMVTSSPVP